MANVQLTAEEAEVLRQVLANLTIKTRTGHLGVLHGMDRFVSMEIILRKPNRDALDAAAKKLGVAGGIRPFDKN